MGGCRCRGPRESSLRGRKRWRVAR